MQLDKSKCHIKNMALKFLQMTDFDMYNVYLISKHIKGIEIAFQAAKAYKEEPNKILALKKLEKICMSNLNGEL